MWTRNFKLFFIGTILSALGGIGLNVAFGVIIFSETQSTFLSSIFTAITMLPNFILPILIGPYIDKQNPLKVLVRNEIILGNIFLISALLTYYNGFNYGLYLFIVLSISSFGVFSELAYSNVLPNIMDKKDYIRGNAIIGTIYPMSSIIVTPIAMLLFKQYGISLIFLVYSFLTFCDAYLESRIKMYFEVEAPPKENIIQTYANDLREAFFYVKENQDLKTITLAVGLMTFLVGAHQLMYPFFNRSTMFTDNDYALVLMMSSVGYAIGGLFHYFVRIPMHRRYQIAISVYFTFAIVDGFMYFYPLWGMIVAKISLGMLGMNSANIRMSAVQQKVENRMRAKVNALMSVVNMGMLLLGNIFFGALGERFQIPYIQLFSNMIYLCGIVYFYLPKKNKIKELYNYKV